ncbi:hypothetical protein D3C81_990140 [compost metagenome]
MRAVLFQGFGDQAASAPFQRQRLVAEVHGHGAAHAAGAVLFHLAAEFGQGVA